MKKYEALELEVVVVNTNVELLASKETPVAPVEGVGGASFGSSLGLGDQGR